MADTEKVIQELGNVTTLLREYTEKNDREVKRLGDAMPETKQALEKINEKLDKLEDLKKAAEEEKARLDKLETRLNRPDNVDQTKAADVDLEVKAYGKALRGHPLTPEESKAVKRVSVSADGEYKILATDNLTSAGALLTPPQKLNEIIKDMSEFSPIRSVARVIQISEKSLQVPKRTAAAAASWVAERGTTSEDTTLAFGLMDIPAHEMTCLYKATNQMVEDSMFPLESMMGAEFAEAFGVKEGTAFVSGTAVGQPEGILTNATVLASYLISGGSATVITADNLIDLAANVKSQYHANGRYACNRKTVAFIRKLKAGDGHYMWQPGLAMGNPATINGYPYFECSDMSAPATASTFTTNHLPVLFGDFRQGYMIIDRIGLTVQRLVELYAASGTIGFLARMRVGGQVINPAAFSVLKVTT